MKLVIEVGFSGVLEYLVEKGHVEPKEATTGGISGLKFLYHKMGDTSKIPLSEERK